MGLVRSEDIIGYEIDGQIVCPECIMPGENDTISEDQILTEDARENGDVRLFCDRCHKEL
jgi:hypothetical protein